VFVHWSRLSPARSSIATSPEELVDRVAVAAKLGHRCTMGDSIRAPGALTSTCHAGNHPALGVPRLSGPDPLSVRRDPCRLQLYCGLGVEPNQTLSQSSQPLPPLSGCRATEGH